MSVGLLILLGPMCRAEDKPSEHVVDELCRCW